MTDRDAKEEVLHVRKNKKCTGRRWIHVAVLRLRLRRPCRGLPTRQDERRQRPKYMTQGIAPWRDKDTKNPSKFPVRSNPRLDSRC